MFLVLDTNHYNALTEDSSLGRKAERRIDDSGMDVFITLVSVQEIAQGWLALINRRRSGRDQVNPYIRFQHSIETLGKLTILAFDEAAAEQFEQLRSLRLRVGTMDLKIAAVCLVHDAILLEQNIADFRSVQGLTAENWLE
jgi:tRNA(fMet)-specific endonuclease VapC